MNRRETLKLLPLSRPAAAAVSVRSAPRRCRSAARLSGSHPDAGDHRTHQGHPVRRHPRNGPPRSRCGQGGAEVLHQLGHGPPDDLRHLSRPSGDTDIFVKDLPATAEKGDMVITNAGRIGSSREQPPRAPRQGRVRRGGPRSWGGDCAGSELIVPDIRKLKLRPFADLWIDLFETAYGAVVWTCRVRHTPWGPHPEASAS